MNMKKIVALATLTLLYSMSAKAGMSHKVFKRPPSEVFAAATRVAQRGARAIVNPKAQTISFQTGTVPEYLGVNKLQVFFSRLPAGCGKADPCTATKVAVKCTKVQLDTMGIRACWGDVRRFYGRLKKELKKARREHNHAAHLPHPAQRTEKHSPIHSTQSVPSRSGSV